MDSNLFDHSLKKSFTDRFFAYLDRLHVSDKFLLKLALIALLGSSLWFIISMSSANRVEVASAGGSFTEGILGTPRFVNPVLAVTRADRDLSALIYDGLMILGQDGSLIPNIAESITISDDGLTYNIVIRKDILFHDKVPLTARDVVFTIGRIQDPGIASPLRANFDGVVVEQIGDYELNFILAEPYAPFIENLSFGILPEHLWKDASDEEFPFSQLNSEPVGAGPYMIAKILRTPSGIPESYILKPNPAYHFGRPKIETVMLKFYPNDTRLISAFNGGEIDALVGLDQSRLGELAINPMRHTVVRIPLPRTFALFYNQNRSAVLRDSGVRKALSASIDRSALVADVLGGYATPITGPVPPHFISGQGEVATRDETLDPRESAREILRTNGWKYNESSAIWEKTIAGSLTPLAFSISTVNNPTFEATVEYLRARWQEIGIQVTVKQFEQSDLTQAVIRPRDYDSLFFGTQLGRSLDFFPFWHSSQRNDPGLNISLYTNITADSILTEERRTLDSEKRNDAIRKFAVELNNENPALFLYAPELLYVFPERVIGESFARVSEPQERFSSIYAWYVNTESVWPIFGQEREGKESTKDSE